MLAAARANVRRSSSSCYPQFYSKLTWTRKVSTRRLDPVIDGFATALAARQPCFAMSADDVRILFRPNNFYQLLLDMIRRARRRIFISSLYIGSKEQELIDTIHSLLSSNSSLHVHLHLDLNRSTRPGASSTTHVISPLLRDYPDRVHVSLFRSPKLSGLMAKIVPPRFNEGWGTWHAKIYGVDDEVMISGANLNESYFTNRQDRYIHFTRQPALADYCFKFLETVSNFSYRLLPSSSSAEECTLLWPDPHTHPHKFQFQAEKALTAFQVSHRTDEDKKDNEVLVFPIIQAGQFNIREEEQCMASLFDHLAVHNPSSSHFTPSMDLTSGYFGLYELYQGLVIRSHIDCRIVAASPKANGFYGSRGISGRIPEGYTLLEQQFMKAVRAAGRESPSDNDRGIELTEWEKDGWTYHAKGMWLSPTPNSAPVLTLFGSTNLNARSAHLDTELSFVMTTSAAALREKLWEEVQGLRRDVRPWKGESRKVRWGTKIIVRIVDGML